MNIFLNGDDCRASQMVLVLQPLAVFCESVAAAVGTKMYDVYRNSQHKKVVPRMQVVSVTVECILA